LLVEDKVPFVETMTKRLAKRDLTNPAMPVIMLTGHGSETAAREGIKFGAFDYLTKPCDLNDLIDL
jgi:DNA-binding NtrC family response regulator